jgi:NAD(P)-dependent dehydrogenase (short-subunit alcohol dehydrogenase family)
VLVRDAELRNKTTVVTGAASGIGRELVLVLARGGARVLGVDRDEPGLRQTCSMAGVDRAFPLVVDLLEPGAEDRILKIAVESLGSPDLFVNCAGIFPSTPALGISAEEWDRVLDLNLKAPFLCSRAYAAHRIGAELPGCVINIASTAAVIPRPGIAHYSASKAGLVMLTRALALEWAEHGIRVNAVAPGLTETPGVRELVSTTKGRLEHEGKIKMVPLGRACEPREVARVVLFLAAAGSAYITGETIFVDGGYSAGRMVPA